MCVWCDIDRSAAVRPLVQRLPAGIRKFHSFLYHSRIELDTATVTGGKYIRQIITYIDTSVKQEAGSVHIDSDSDDDEEEQHLPSSHRRRVAYNDSDDDVDYVALVAASEAVMTPATTTTTTSSSSTTSSNSQQ